MAGAIGVFAAPSFFWLRPYNNANSPARVQACTRLVRCEIFERKLNHEDTKRHQGSERAAKVRHALSHAGHPFSQFVMAAPCGGHPVLSW
jgi:hypothetical protein